MQKKQHIHVSFAVLLSWPPSVRLTEDPAEHRSVQVEISEVRVLLGVQDLQQGGRGISASVVWFRGVDSRGPACTGVGDIWVI